MILALLRALAWFYYALPAAARRLAGAGLGLLLRAVSLRAEVVRQNLRFAFPEPAQEPLRRRLYRESYSHLGQLVFEIFMLLGPMRRFVLRHGAITGVEHWQRAREQGKGVIFLASHVGNWEIMTAVGTLHAGMDVMMVTKHLKPEWLHRAIEAGRMRCGVRATYEPKTLRDVLAHLKRNGTVGFVLDQYAGPPVGVRVPFFGVPVSTTTAIAALARRTSAVVLPVVNYRRADGSFVVEVHPPLSWETHEDRDVELAANTAAFVRRVQDFVMAHPAQWLWIHRRFKGDLSPLRSDEWSSGRPRR